MVLVTIPCMNMGQRITQLRAERGWTQQRLVDLANEAARRAGMEFDDDKPPLSQQALDRLEKRNSTTSSSAPFIADALGVSLRWLLTGVGRPTDDDRWPFALVPRALWDRASDETRAFAQGALKESLRQAADPNVIAEHQGQPGGTRFGTPTATVGKPRRAA